MQAQNCTSRFNNLGNWISIWTGDTSMSLWWNSLMVYAQIFLFKKALIFNHFSCPIFRKFQWLSKWDHKTALLYSINWVIGSRFGREDIILLRIGRLFLMPCPWKTCITIFINNRKRNIKVEGKVAIFVRPFF